MTNAAFQAARERHEANQLESVIRRVADQNQHGRLGMASHVQADIQRLLDGIDRLTATHAQTLELWAAEEVHRWKLEFYAAELEKFASPEQRVEAVEFSRLSFDITYADDYWPGENALEGDA